MKPWYDFEDEFGSPNFNCGGTKKVSLPDVPHSSRSRLDSAYKVTYFHFSLQSGSCDCKNKEVVWEGCQVIGLKGGKEQLYFGTSKAACTKSAIKGAIGDWWEREWPDLPENN